MPQAAAVTSKAWEEDRGRLEDAERPEGGEAEAELEVGEAAIPTRGVASQRLEKKLVGRKNLFLHKKKENFKKKQKKTKNI
jgi:hypothetical protein